MENQEEEAKDGYRDIFLFEQDHQTVEPVTGRNYRDPPLQTKFLQEEGLKSDKCGELKEMEVC